MAEKTISIRLSEDLLECADTLIPMLKQHGDLAAVGVTRSTVLRLALLRGMEQLKAESEKVEKQRTN